jgi:DNA-binding beta-propeller fold protein YncE
MRRDQIPESVPASGTTLAAPGRRGNPALAAAVIVALAGTVAWVPAASASTGQVSLPTHASRVAGTARSLLTSGDRQRAVTVPPTVSVGNGPDGLAFDRATRTLYTSNQNASSVSVINTATCNARHPRGCRQRVRSVSLPADASPQGIALNAATGTIYVANIAGNSISVINARTCNATSFSGCRQTPASIKDPGGPIALAVDQATDTVYVANTGDNFSGTNHTVSVINGATCNGHRHTGCGHTPRTVRVGAGPDGVAVDQATHTVYVANNGPTNNGDTVSVINGATCNGRRHSGCGQAAASVRVGHGPFWIAVDQATHTAYTANNTDSTVSVINTASCNGRRHSGCGQRTSAVPVGFRPWALTIDRALHRGFVLNNWDDTMSAINTLTCDAAHRSGCGHRPDTSQVGKGPQAVITDPATGTVYAANFTDSTVSVINPDRCDATRARGCRHRAPTTRVGAGPDAIAVDRALHTVYVANGGGTTFSGGGNTVSVINAATCNAHRRTGCGRPAATIRVGAGPDGITVDQATGTVYTANSGAGTVSVINAATCNAHQHSGCGQTPPTITVGTGPLGIAVNQATHTLYVTNPGNFSGKTVSVINTATCNAVQHSGCGQTPATITVGPVPWGIAINQASNTIYVANNNGGDGPAGLSVINGATCDATNTSGCSQIPPAIPGVGRAPNGIALNQTTRTVYTANALDATVSVIDVATPTTRHPANPPRVAVGSLPEAIAIDAANHTIYIADAFDGTVSILPERPVRAPRTAGSEIPAMWPVPAGTSQRGQPEHVCRSFGSCNRSTAIAETPSPRIRISKRCLRRPCSPRCSAHG